MGTKRRLKQWLCPSAGMKHYLWHQNSLWHSAFPAVNTIQMPWVAGVGSTAVASSLHRLASLRNTDGASAWKVSAARKLLRSLAAISFSCRAWVAKKDAG